MQIIDLRPADERAVRQSVEVVAKAGRDDLGRPTPCSAWTLGDLLAHMTAQHRGFAAAARGCGGDPAIWRPRPLGADPAAAYAEAAEEVLSAFAGRDVPAREFALPEIGPGVTVSGAQAIGFHFIDYVVHAWDVARSLGLPYELDDDLAEDALRVASAVPGGEYRTRPGASFGPELPEPGNPSPLDRILTALGRSPNWPDGA
ncbi:TIGR03086 family metal-binding protein [Actinoallomurus rhizosphaericola]|uniref:TIGR03086 family metal-binding protein n=1 Tax=Actinoallomurus rhizosphaericola TaxID=2952536 RepID=UPI0020903CA1|nr:TIGR03086 family metal-binding protein [Actinoallomurus rhizosphaericola]MCO5993767.1 TIGR03086 family metal-binding protein [Actinoallomurus rhizosphaericola]